MFLWFMKKFMKKLYKKYLNELDEFNHLKMDIIQNYDQYNIAGKAQSHLNTLATEIVEFIFQKNNKFSKQNEFIIIFGVKFIGFRYVVNHNNYDIFYNGKCLSKRFKRKAFEFIKEMIFDNENPTNWYLRCDKIIE